jgi:hypothetical protein
MDIVTWTSTGAGSVSFNWEDPVSINLVLRPVGALVFEGVVGVPLVVPVPGVPRTVGPSFVALLARESGVFCVWWTSLVAEGAGVGLAARAEWLRATGAGVEGLGVVKCRNAGTRGAFMPEARLTMSVRTLLLVILANVEHKLGR